MGPLIPMLSTFGDVCSGLFVYFLDCVILRCTIGATPADCIKTEKNSVVLKISH